LILDAIRSCLMCTINHCIFRYLLLSFVKIIYYTVTNFKYVNKKSQDSCPISVVVSLFTHRILCSCA
jgi:hypothetical protein